jgi:hypothetical protein
MSSGGVAVIVVVIVVLTVAAGLLANRRRPRVSAVGASPVVMVGSWLGSGDMVGRVATLAAVLVAFSIVQGFLSFRSASVASDNEANAVRGMFELANYEPPPERAELKDAAVCYARAVSHLEWETMRTGGVSPVVSAWTGTFREVFQQLGDDRRPAFSMLLAGNRDREVARRQRMAETQPAVPVTIFWLMVVTAAVSVGWVAFTLPRVESRTPLIVALGILTGCLGAALLIANDLQRPFAGVARVTPHAITTAENDMVRDLTGSQGTESLPCDDRGRPQGVSRADREDAGVTLTRMLRDRSRRPDADAGSGCHDDSDRGVRGVPVRRVGPHRHRRERECGEHRRRRRPELPEVDGHRVDRGDRDDRRRVADCERPAPAPAASERPAPAPPAVSTRSAPRPIPPVRHHIGVPAPVPPAVMSTPPAPPRPEPGATVDLPADVPSLPPDVDILAVGFVAAIAAVIVLT